MGKMEDIEKKKTEIEQAGQELFEFAIDREDTKWLLAQLPEAADVKRTTVEYELPLLKIISVGWSISYFLEESPYKTPLQERYWNAVNEFSHGLSETTGLMIGQDIDYFQILKERFDFYVKAMADHPEATEPSAIIGPEFAGLCGNKDDIFASLTGSKMFGNTMIRVRQYIDALKLD